MSNFVYIDTDGLEKAKPLAITDLPSGLENVQSDWNQTDNAADDYIKNKPTIPNGWMRKNGISTTVPFNSNEAIYFSTWDTPTDSENWNADLVRTTTDRLKNNGTATATVRDNFYALVQLLPTVIDFTNVTFCYVELWYGKYNSSNTLQESVMLDKQYVPFFDGGTVEGWCGVNLSVHGDITYKLASGDYSKIWIKVAYDGQTPNVSIDNGYHEHEIINI